ESWPDWFCPRAGGRTPKARSRSWSPTSAAFPGGSMGARTWPSLPRSTATGDRTCRAGSMTRSRGWAWTAWPAGPSGNTGPGCASGGRWRAACSPMPTCSCSTSPRAGSTPTPPSACGGSCATTSYAVVAARFCSRPMISPRRACWPAGSRFCAAVASKTCARPRRSKTCWWCMRRPSFGRVLLAFLVRELREALSYKIALVLQGGALLLALGALYYLARFIGASKNPALQPYGSDYLGFALIGFVVTEVQQVAIGSFALRVRHAQLAGTLEAMLSTPARPWQILLAAPIGDFLEAFVRAGAYILLATLAFGLRLHSAHVGPALLAGLLGLGAF